MKSFMLKMICCAGLVAVLPTGLAMAAQEQFQTPEQAVQALAAAAAARDSNALNHIFGPALRELVSPDAVQASNRFALFARRIAEKTQLAKPSETNALLEIGNDAWPFPIPLVQQDGQWRFDTEAGKEEILNRRIGMNELGTIRVCRTYVLAQREYASEQHDGDEVLQFAQTLRSSPHKHDGLYWHADAGEAVSPLGPLIAAAKGEGYHKTTKIMAGETSPYHGYYFKILTRQGRHAPGGKYDYVINGRMIAGFALVAWPAEWGNSGVMTFIVNQQGKVYQKDLGPRTEAIAVKMTAYDPDSSWKLTQVP